MDAVCSPRRGAAVAAAIATPSSTIGERTEGDRSPARAGRGQIEPQPARLDLRVGEDLARPS